MRSATTAPILLAAGLALVGCRSDAGSAGALGLFPEPAPRTARVDSDGTALPLSLPGSAYDAAGVVQLPDVAPTDYPSIAHVYALSDSIVTGGEPLDPEALFQVAEWGVKTVLSVDGKVPDAETARALGMRYVHVPVRYKGFTDEELLKITKVFRELEGPFYVHCFHGKHRGPAAAAIGRIAIDGLGRERAIAEMREWCGTAQKYEGLYRTVATAEIPTAADTAAFDYDFAEAHEHGALRETMIELMRVYDEIDLVAQPAGWNADPAHPDIDALQSATQISQLLRACDGRSSEVPEAGADYDEMMAESITAADVLVAQLTDGRAEGAPEPSKLDAAFAEVKATCRECHTLYRNR
ncbi:MAG: hypothetical protein AAFZ87_04380 [Planctomycetota bacterium]